MFGLNAYHNTLQLPNTDTEERKAQKQDSQVLKVFEDHPYTSFTSYEIWLHFGQQMKESSVRRAISNLLKAEQVRATGEKRDGGFGSMVNCWILNR